MCSGQRYRSNGMQYDLLRSTYSSFDAAQQEKHNSGKMNVVSLLSIKLLLKNCFAKTAILEFLLSEGQTVDLRSNLRTIERELKELPNTLFAAL